MSHTTSAPVSRRNVLVGTAWAAPAVVVAAGVPAAASSGSGTTVFATLTKSAGTSIDNKAKSYTLTLKALSTAVPIGSYVVATSPHGVNSVVITSGATGWSLPGGGTLTRSTAVLAGAQVQVTVTVNLSNADPKGAGDLTFTLHAPNGAVVSAA